MRACKFSVLADWVCMGWSSCQTQWRTRYSRFNTTYRVPERFQYIIVFPSLLRELFSLLCGSAIVGEMLVGAEGHRRRGGGGGGGAALCPCPSSLFLLFFSSLPLFLLPSPASSAPLFANVPCQSPRSLTPFSSFCPFQVRGGNLDNSVADMIYEDARNESGRKLQERARGRAVVAWYWFFPERRRGFS